VWWWCCHAERRAWQLPCFGACNSFTEYWLNTQKNAIAHLDSRTKGTAGEQQAESKTQLKRNKQSQRDSWKGTSRIRDTADKQQAESETQLKSNRQNQRHSWKGTSRIKDTAEKQQAESRKATSRSKTQLKNKHSFSPIALQDLKEVVKPIGRTIADQLVPSGLVLGPSTQASPLGSLVHVRAEVLESSVGCRTAMHAIPLHQSLTKLKQLAGSVHVSELFVCVVLLA